MIKLVNNLWNNKKPKIKKDFKKELEEKNYSLGLALYATILESIDRFEKSSALDEFILRVEDVQRVESYFPKDNSIETFKKKIRQEYNTQINLVLEEVKEVLLNIYAQRYLEIQNEQNKQKSAGILISKKNVD